MKWMRSTATTTTTNDHFHTIENERLWIELERVGKREGRIQTFNEPECCMLLCVFWKFWCGCHEYPSEIIIIFCVAPVLFLVRRGCFYGLSQRLLYDMRKACKRCWVALSYTTCMQHTHNGIDCLWPPSASYLRNSIYRHPPSTTERIIFVSSVPTLDSQCHRRHHRLLLFLSARLRFLFNIRHIRGRGGTMCAFNFYVLRRQNTFSFLLCFIFHFVVFTHAILRIDSNYSVKAKENWKNGSWTIVCLCVVHSDRVDTSIHIQPHNGTVTFNEQTPLLTSIIDLECLFVRCVYGSGVWESGNGGLWVRSTHSTKSMSTNKTLNIMNY